MNETKAPAYPGDGEEKVGGFICSLRDGAHSIGVQNVTSNCNVATLNSFPFSLYIARRLAAGETFIRW